MMASSASAVASASSAVSAFGAPSSNSPCAACKFLRRKCQPDCVFAPYFPPDQPQKFAHVHKVFGASNVTKLLNELSPYQREDAVNSLAYEAEMRLRDPVYGCVGIISVLQHQLRQLQMDLTYARSELSKYQATAATTTSAATTATTLGITGSVGNGLLNVNHSIGLGSGTGFGREQFFGNGHSHMMMRSCDSEMAARIGMHGGYDTGFVAAAMNTSAVGIGPFGFPFPKPRTAGGYERQAIGPS